MTEGPNADLGDCSPFSHNCCGIDRPVELFRAARLGTKLQALLNAAIDEAISRKPKGHDFVIDRRHQRPALARHMSVTGG